MGFINDNIKKFRLEADLSRDALAEKFKDYGSKISGKTIQNWEAGIFTPSGAEIAILAQIFEKPVAYFFESISYLPSKEIIPDTSDSGDRSAS